MHGITCHAEAALSSAAVELSTVRVPSACCHLVGSRRAMHGITCCSCSCLMHRVSRDAAAARAAIDSGCRGTIHMPRDAAAMRAAIAECMQLLSWAQHHVPSVRCHLVGSSQWMPGITCHAAAASKSAAVGLSAASRAERMLSLCGQQPIDAWHHVPCCSCMQECGCSWAKRGIACRAYAATVWAVANRCMASRAMLQLHSRVQLSS